MEELKSKLDASVNFVVPVSDGGYFESRYVRRSDDYFICYLSSQSGCNRGCRMCHLTATGQTMMTDATPANFMEQAEHVFTHYRTQTPAKYVHFNWMARGEPLCNTSIIDAADYVFERLGKLAETYGLIPRFNISTIMPTTFRKPLDEMFRLIHPTIYYSLYSVKDEFRQKWLPGAMPVDNALQMLADYQQSTKKYIKLHWAFIEGENDSVKDLKLLLDKVNYKYKLRAEYNVVRYNPFSADYGAESEDLDLLVYVMKYCGLTSAVQVVPRVGADIMASCGMFYSGE